MKITITHTKEYRNKYGELNSSLTRTVKGIDINEISTMFCIEDINYTDIPCDKFDDCVDCWINELQQYNRTLDYKNRAVTFEKVERMQHAK